MASGINDRELRTLARTYEAPALQAKENHKEALRWEAVKSGETVIKIWVVLDEEIFIYTVESI